MKDELDYWSGDEFEDNVASALVACYESKPIKNKGCPPEDRMNEQRLQVLRNIGPYISSGSRIIIGDNSFDMVNDTLPKVGCFGFAVKPTDAVKQNHPDAYFASIYVKKTDSLGKRWCKRKGGELYEMVTLIAKAQGITGERSFFTVTKNGEVSSCNVQIASTAGYMPGVKQTILSHEDNYLLERETWASVTLNAEADKRFCWTITAKEADAKVHLGCMKEEIKSLLYARELPMTATGRKRPVLHLVEAHKRRIKAGTDINIDSFLRGVQTVEIGGTQFTINPPRNIQPVVSEPSQKFFEVNV
jgi:hypothetical protein